MQPVIRWTLPLTCLVAASVQAAPADAQRIEKSYQSAMQTWTTKMEVSRTPEARLQAFKERPDASNYARGMWGVIGNSLDQDWTLEPAAWFLRLSGSILAPDGAGNPKPVFAKENDAIRKAVERWHLASPKLAPVCAALSASPNPRSLAVLEKIQATHPDQKIQGIAAFGAALQLKTLGDSPDIMPKRLTYLRKAIIQSAYETVEGIPISKLAEDELYIINNLSKGRVAPDLVGVDSGGRPLMLSSHVGKTVILTFWNSNLEDSQRIVDMTTALQTKFKDQAVAVIGVNNDSIAKLRTLEGSGTVPWKSFSDPENKLANHYRIATRPLVYVLDGERKIQYIGAPGSFVEFTVDALLAPKKPEAPSTSVPTTGAPR